MSAETDPGYVRDEYSERVCGERPSCALSLLALWDAPHSTRALRFAFHALQRAAARGIDVLE